MNENIILDFERKNRCGVEEAIFAEGKSVEQLIKIISMAIDEKKRLLFTRLTPIKYEQLPKNYKASLIYDDVGYTAILGEAPTFKDAEFKVAIVSGGASDHKVCKEIGVTLNYHGIACCFYEDVGVSAIWRLESKLEYISKAKIIIAVAGMEAALPTVLAGMLPNPIIAVPTSIGYGVSEGGNLALNSCLGSCASGIVTVNIDNGFGAACAAIKMIKQFNV